MKYFSLTLFAVFSLSAFSQSILLKGGMVHSGTGAGATLQDILISGNEIAKIGKNLTINGKTQVIELNGLPVTPGLISPMSNLGIVEINALDVTRDDESDILKAGFSIFNAFNPSLYWDSMEQKQWCYKCDYQSWLILISYVWIGILFYLGWQSRNQGPKRYCNVWTHGGLIWL